ncbi:MAG: hypothetical protein DMD33_19545 [Gemmatimonadetes bacterium]|nr:MAG: hypothetical protein DMD33_19545 [Gemmatimonadota bacterium]
MRLLLPTDFSPASERGEAEGARLARSLDAEIVVLHVVQELDMYGSGRAKIADLMAMRSARLTAARVHSGPGSPRSGRAACVRAAS